MIIIYATRFAKLSALRYEQRLLLMTYPLREVWDRDTGTLLGHIRTDIENPTDERRPARLVHCLYRGDIVGSQARVLEYARAALPELNDGSISKILYRHVTSGIHIDIGCTEREYFHWGVSPSPGSEQPLQVAPCHGAENRKLYLHMADIWWAKDIEELAEVVRSYSGPDFLGPDS